MNRIRQVLKISVLGLKVFLKWVEEGGRMPPLKASGTIWFTASVGKTKTRTSKEDLMGWAVNVKVKTSTQNETQKWSGRD